MKEDTGEPEDLIPASSKDIPHSLQEMESRRIMQALTPGERFALMFGAKLPSIEEKIRTIKKR